MPGLICLIPRLIPICPGVFVIYLRFRLRVVSGSCSPVGFADGTVKCHFAVDPLALAAPPRIQVNGSGLWVHTAGLADGRDGPDGAFFVPLRSRDVVVHGWDVEDHQRIAIIVWTQPKEDLGTGLCSWYLREALQGDDSEAAYHLGIEAWRQQMLGDLDQKGGF
eukprot:s1445_g9.t1